MKRVVWINPDPHWDESIIRELTADDEYQHGCYFNAALGEGGVIVIPGQHHIDDAYRLADWVSRLPWALVIVTSDEEALFPVELLPSDERHAVWNQYHDRGMDRVIPIGARPGTWQYVGISGVGHKRDNGTFFAGQDTHARRHELLDVMKDMACDPNRYGNVSWLATTGFQQGLTQQQYLDALLRTKIAPCPSGPHSLDSFRLYEALAAGALPVVETHTQNGDEGAFWPKLLGQHCPIPRVESWSELPAIVERYRDEDAWRVKRDEVLLYWNYWREGLDMRFRLEIERLRS